MAAAEVVPFVVCAFRSISGILSAWHDALRISHGIGKSQLAAGQIVPFVVDALISIFGVLSASQDASRLSDSIGNSLVL